MKYKGQYILAFIVIVVAVYFIATGMSITEYIEPNNDENSSFSVWNSAIAASINEKPIDMLIDGNQVNTKYGHVYMDETMTLMVPSDVITSAFDCAVSLYNDEELIIEKGDIKLKMAVDKKVLSINGAKYTISVAPVKRGKILYVPLSAIVRGFGYGYSWDIENNRATLVNENTDNRALPYAYNYRENGRNTKVRDQGKFNTCWAVASLCALETALQPEENLLFSADHMSLCNSFNVSQFDSGDFYMSMAYLTAWQGPVYESDDPYGDRQTNRELKPVKHVQEAQIIPSKDLEGIKKMVYQYGGVETSIYMSLKDAKDKSKNYNEVEGAYCYIGEEKPNHEVVIVGWDDNYPKENFNSEIESNGAFICQNSWGEEFGNGGYFYVSYYDTNIGVHNLVYTDVEDTDNYDKIYQSDLCGWRGLIGYEKDSAYFANAYTTSGKEILSAVGFYATDVDSSYNVYVVRNFKDTEDFLNKQEVASGKLKNAGYYTIPLQDTITLNEGEKYAVVVKINTPNSQRPVAVEMVKSYVTLSVDLSDGEGYISQNGTTWNNTETEFMCNVCLKAYTKVVSPQSR